MLSYVFIEETKEKGGKRANFHLLRDQLNVFITEMNSFQQSKAIGNPNLVLNISTGLFDRLDRLMVESWDSIN